MWSPFKELYNVLNITDMLVTLCEICSYIVSLSIVRVNVLSLAGVGDVQHLLNNLGVSADPQY